MKQTINFNQFYDAFQAIRPDNFSYEGLKVLFDYFEQLEEETGIEYDLDVIAICCEYSEMTYGEVISYYIYNDGTVYDDIWHDLVECGDEEERNELILGWLQDRTTVLEVENDRLIISE